MEKVKTIFFFNIYQSNIIFETGKEKVGNNLIYLRMLKGWGGGAGILGREGLGYGERGVRVRGGRGRGKGRYGIETGLYI